MHIFKALLRAGPSHPTYSPGKEIPASVFVDSDSEQVAIGLARARLTELGWDTFGVISTVQLPPEPDLANLSPQLREAVALANKIGVSLIAYPPHDAADLGSV